MFPFLQHTETGGVDMKQRKNQAHAQDDFGRKALELSKAKLGVERLDQPLDLRFIDLTVGYFVGRLRA